MPAVHNTMQWISRALVVLVFASNMYCAISFVVNPASFVDAYQLSGEGARAAIAGIGIAFAMWNVTYIPLIVFPYKYRAVFGIVIAQQLVGLAGEIWIYQGLGLSQAILASSIMRFIVFDAVGLVLLIIAGVIALRG
ncbi:MAG: hypothetical protein IJ131_09665 [Eggerthellaceae bacterium]|nr:hypothetical protein [Eggerthellaceae bacterium]